MKKIIVTIAISFFIGIAAEAQNNSQSIEKNTMEKQLIQTVTNLFKNVDARNWSQVKSAMTENVYFDFSSLSGVPAANKSSEEIVSAWSNFMPGFDSTHHQISNFHITRNGDTSSVSYYGIAHHYIGNEVWIVEGNYDTELIQTSGLWLVTKHKLTLLKQSGNKDLPVKAADIMKEKQTRKIQFISEGLILKGNLHLPSGFSETKKYKGIVVVGSWTTVKEQMADLYAQKLSQQGYVSLTFDFRNYGESEGQPRNYEVPEMKGQDIFNAVNYLKTLKFIDKDNIGGLGICAGSGYMLIAIINGADIKAISLVAPWLHNHVIVRELYGGEKGVNERIAKSQAAKRHFTETGKVEYVPIISTTDSDAAMFGNFDYYLNKNRGAIKEWNNEFAVMAWEGWLEFDPIQYAAKLSVPVLIVESKTAAVPQGAELFYNNLESPKKIIWVEKATQFDFYDQEPYTTNAVNETGKWFTQRLH